MKVLSLYLVDLPLSFYDHSPLSKAIHTYMHALSFIRDSVILRVVLSHNFNKFSFLLRFCQNKREKILAGPIISCLKSKICHGLPLTIRNLSVFLMTYEKAGKLLLNIFLIFSPSVPSFCWKFHYVPHKGVLYERYCVYFHTYTVRVTSRKFGKRFKMEKYHAD